MSLFRTITIAGVLLAVGQLAQATTVGMNTNALGSRLDDGIKFAFWDMFTQTQVDPPPTATYIFNGVADPTSTLTGLSLTQMTPHAISPSPGTQGAGLLDEGDSYFAALFAQSWSLSATASIDISEISFQIKVGNVSLATINTLFIPTLNGVGAGTFFSGVPSGDGSVQFPNYTIEYRWTGLDIPAGTPLDIQFSLGTNQHKPIDFVALDISNVPEPTVALCGIAGTLLLSGVRRRRS